MAGYSKDLVWSWLGLFPSSKSLGEIVCESPILSRTDCSLNCTAAGMDCHTVASIVGYNFCLSGHSPSSESYIRVKVVLLSPLLTEYHAWSRASLLNGCGNLNWWMTLMAAGMGWGRHSYILSIVLAFFLSIVPADLFPDGKRAEGVQPSGQRNWEPRSCPVLLWQ